jgi:hypothetical protein
LFFINNNNIIYLMNSKFKIKNSRQHFLLLLTLGLFVVLPHKTQAQLTPPTITSHPADIAVDEGQNTTFSVTATGNPASYQWTCQFPGTNDWLPLSSQGIYSGVNTATLTLTNVTASRNGYRFRCDVSNSSGTVSSNAATLTVYYGPGIAKQPDNSTIIAGGNTSFSVTATGNPAPTYEWWYHSQADGNKKVPEGGMYSGANTSTLTLTNVPASYNGYQYYCFVTNYFETTGSNYATLTVTTLVTPPTISNLTVPGTEITTTIATAYYNLDKQADVYYMLYLSSATAPDATTIKAQNTGILHGQNNLLSGRFGTNLSSLTPATGYTL